MTENQIIKIFVSCDKDSYVPENPYLFPVQAGSALASERFTTMLHDDVGNNISAKNRSYCELTTQYWAWKNQKSDYYGFFHYRRYMCFDESLEVDDYNGNIIAENLSSNILKELSIEPGVMRKYITTHDAIVVRERKVVDVSNIYDEYVAPITQNKKDIDTVIDIIKHDYTDFVPAMEKYFSSDLSYDCNMFIMKKEIFNDYCSWLFDILEKAEKRIDTTNYSVQEYRVFGFLAERLCGIYFTYLQMSKSFNIGKLPKVLFNNTSKPKIMTTINEDAIPIVLSANDRFVPYLNVMISSILKYSSNNRKYDVIILNGDISETNKNIIKSENTKENFYIRFINVNEYFDKGKLFVDQHLSIETYYRLIIPEIMPNYHKILYLDCDMVVLEDVAKLYDINLQGNIIGAVRDIDIIGQIKSGGKQLEKYIKEKLELNNPLNYFQCGTLILDLDKLKKYTSSKELIDIACSYSFRCHDQDVLNKVFKDKVLYLPQKWNVLMNWENPTNGTNRAQFLKMAPKELFYEYETARKNPLIIHYAGYQKPWECVDCDLSLYFWEIAKNTVYYPNILSKVNSSLAEERYIASLPKPIIPLPEKKGRVRRAYECIADHGISYSVILLMRRIVKRISGRYTIVNGERVYEK